jgi:2-amino-4-hydroxy-6-hydroxymethyldihydropteridine diphosphokinase
MTLYYIGVGSNEEAEYNCRQMIQALRHQFGRLSVSSLIRTSAEGVDAPDYYNAVVCFQSECSIAAVNQWCKRQEARQGRVRGGLSCRADLDVLLAVADLSEVLLRRIQEHYYHPLVRQLLSFQTGKEFEVFSAAITLSLDDEHRLAKKPQVLSECLMVWEGGRE